MIIGQGNMVLFNRVAAAAYPGNGTVGKAIHMDPGENAERILSGVIASEWSKEVPDPVPKNHGVSLIRVGPARVFSSPCTREHFGLDTNTS
jgi:hypothetical protein